MFNYVYLGSGLNDLYLFNDFQCLACRSGESAQSKERRIKFSELVCRQLGHGSPVTDTKFFDLGTCKKLLL